MLWISEHPECCHLQRLVQHRAGTLAGNITYMPERIKITLSAPVIDMPVHHVVVAGIGRSPGPARWLIPGIALVVFFGYGH